MFSLAHLHSLDLMALSNSCIQSMPCRSLKPLITCEGEQNTNDDVTALSEHVSHPMLNILGIAKVLSRSLYLAPRIP